MKILQVIHGYPMRYNAGSEVYTQTLCHGLSQRHQVHVFTREEDSFAPDFAIREESDPLDPRIRLHLVNMARSRDRYRHVGVDQRFAELCDRLQPDVIHIGHLNHLSTSLVLEASAREIPVVYTLHDYWIMCPRGQFMQMHPADASDLWTACDGQQNRKCAERCYARYFSGNPADDEQDIAHWTGWVDRRMRHIREVAERVDLFIAPSRYLYQRYRDEFGLLDSKLVYLDYGFDLKRFRSRNRLPGEPFTFGYIGTHIPAKGIHVLIEAFGKLRGDCQLRIWGRPRGQDTESLKALAAAQLGDQAAQVHWLPEYRNQDIMSDVFDRVDAIVVPSVWVENSPLVIHEALQARVPVVTADIGGMAEYVQHEANGLLFAHRNADALALQLQRLLDDPGLAAKLESRGYLQSTTGDIPSIEDHVLLMEQIYSDVVRRRDSAQLRPLAGPWRVTIDTNPDTCNLRCIMCEEHSPHSQAQVQRKQNGKPRREMPLDLLRRVLNQAAELGTREIIPSTMGEPLLYDHFDEIIDFCVQRGLKLNLTTNGTFPGRGARAWAERIVPVTSDVKISWNGATAKTQELVMLGARWDKGLMNLREFIAVRDAHAEANGYRCQVTLQLTFLESNVSELPDLVRMAIELGVDRVKGHHLWAHFHEIEALSLRRSPESIHRWNAAVLGMRAAAQERLLPSGVPILLENMFLLDLGAMQNLAPGGPCPFLGQEAWVSAEGRFDPCCAPDAKRRTLGEFGNLNAASLSEIWRSPGYQELTKSYRTRELCLGCNMRRPVDGT